MKKFPFSLTLILLAFTFLVACSDDDNDDPATPAPNNPNNPIASNYCYNFQNGTVAYDSIQGGNTIGFSSGNADGIIEIPIGFNFELCGAAFDKLFMADFGYNVSFTVEVTQNAIDYREYELLPVGDLDHTVAFDTNNFQTLSIIKTQNTGSAPNRVFTLELRDFGVDDFGFSPTEIFSYQIKLYEGSNAIEFVYGPNNVTSNFGNDPFNNLIIGHYAVNPNDGLYLRGDRDNPTASPRILGQIPTFPRANTRYRFTRK